MNGQKKDPKAVAFQQRKATFLGKDDKSSAGGIDVHAREVCAVINERADAFTTSSCSGRAYLWRGEGVKSTTKFLRYRVTHELIPDAEPYFNLQSLDSEVVDGAWEEQRHRMREKLQIGRSKSSGSTMSRLANAARCICSKEVAVSGSDPVVWLRFEPFILHVCCKNIAVAGSIITAARVVFKNVGIQSFAEGKSMVAIWGDESLEMALSDPNGRPLFSDHSAWLQEAVNSRHHRNWAKIDRFTEALRALPAEITADLPAELGISLNGDDHEDSQSSAPKHYDIIGDVIVLATAPAEQDREAVGAKLLSDNRKARIVAARCGSLQTDHRKPVNLDIIAGLQRSPLMTTHTEFGVRYVINLEAVFFSARMSAERQRICRQVQAGENVFVAFAGCAPEALQILDKVENASIVAVELNPAAVDCARKSLALVEKKDAARASRMRVIEGDVCSVADGQPRGVFDRIVAPRPKGTTEAEDDELVAKFLHSLLPLLKPGGICIWYDFVADWEFPDCARSVGRLSKACEALGRKCTVLYCAKSNTNPVAERQYRTVIDFSVV